MAYNMPQRFANEFEARGASGYDVWNQLSPEKQQEAIARYGSPDEQQRQSNQSSGAAANDTTDIGQTQVSNGGIGGTFGMTHTVGVHGVDPNLFRNQYLDEQRRRLTGEQNRVIQEQAFQAQSAQAAGGNFAPQEQWRNQQSALAQTLMNTANGTGPSVAQNQLRQATTNNINAALAMGARGGGNGVGSYLAGQSAGQANQQAAGQASTLRAQEALGAQSMLGGLLQGARTQDIGVGQLGQQNNQFNAGLQQQAGLFNAGASNALQGQQNALGVSYEELRQRAEAGDLAAKQRMAELNQAALNGGTAMEQRSGEQSSAAAGNLLNGALQAGGTLIAGPLAGMAGGALGAALNTPSNGGFSLGGYANQLTPPVNPGFSQPAQGLSLNSSWPGGYQTNQQNGYIAPPPSY